MRLSTFCGLHLDTEQLLSESNLLTIEQNTEGRKIGKRKKMQKKVKRR
jgi:hypothetical protein